MVNGTHTLEVWGDFACFTRPEMKVERFSYPVITPSAARGIFDAIYWDGKREQRGGDRRPAVLPLAGHAHRGAGAAALHRLAPQ